MTVADQYAAAMAALTAARTGQMRSRGRATRAARPGPTPTLDADGNVVGADPVEVYDGPCTLSDPTSAQSARQGTTADEAGVPSARVLKVPHDADLRPGYLWTVTVSPDSPSLVGDAFVVIGEEERSYATYRRYLLRGSSWLPTSSGT